MYWPIAAPRVYVARVPPPAVPIDYDSEGSAELVRRRLSVSSAVTDAEADPDVNGSTKNCVEEEDEGRKVGEQEVEDEESLPDTPGATSHHHRRSSESCDEARSHITAIRVARNGHLFATITRTELTIWQTKVCLSRERRTLGLPALSRPPLSHTSEGRQARSSRMAQMSTSLFAQTPRYSSSKQRLDTS